ncbi:hypothetical protein ACOME3_006127 [Neoechinorhynchus agilis]
MNNSDTPRRNCYSIPVKIESTPSEKRSVPIEILRVNTECDNSKLDSRPEFRSRTSLNESGDAGLWSTNHTSLFQSGIISYLTKKFRVLMKLNSYMILILPALGIAYRSQSSDRNANNRYNTVSSHRSPSYSHLPSIDAPLFSRLDPSKCVESSKTFLKNSHLTSESRIGNRTSRAPPQGSLSLHVKSTDMSKEMCLRSTSIISSVLDRQSRQTSYMTLAKEIKSQHDEYFGPYWHCIVGRHFAAFVTHDAATFIYLNCGPISILLFKST